MPEISHQQAEALRTLEWLLSAEDEQRRSGRSLMMALAYLRYALLRASHRRPPGDWVRVVDHAHTFDESSAIIVMRYIEDIARDAGLEIQVQIRGGISRFRTMAAEDYERTRHYLFEEFIETDIHTGLSEEQLAQQRLIHGVRPEVGPGALAAVERLGGLAREGLTLVDQLRDLHLLPSPRQRGAPDPILRETLLSYVKERPGETAAQITQVLNRNRDHANSYHCGTVSSILLKEVKANNLRREPNCGPRGGFGYFPAVQEPPAPPVVGPSVWELLKQNPYAGVG